MREILTSEPQADVIESTAAKVLFMAGIGSGKSHVIGLIAADFIKNNPELIGFIGANTYRQLSQSTLKRVFDVWKELFGWKKGVHYVVDRRPPAHYKIQGAELSNYKHTICFRNGAMIYTASLDNYKVLDGTEFAYALLDETKDTKEEAVTEVVTARLRQPGLWLDDEGILYDLGHYKEYTESGRWKYTEVADERILFDYEIGSKIRSYNPLMIFTSPAKVDWLNTWFGLTDYYDEINKKIFSKTEYFKHETQDTCVVISSTYHNEDNLPVSFISDKLKQYRNMQNRIDMLIFGSPIAKSGGEFIPKFLRLHHVKKVAYISSLPIHLTLDFNVAPYMTGLACQYVPKGSVLVLPDGTVVDATIRAKLRIFKAYCLPSPNNNTEAICNALKRDYPTMTGLYYYGDPSGRNRQTVSTEYRDNYAVVEKVLARYLRNSSDRVPSGHPSVLDSRDFLNDLFAENKYEIDLEIDESCKELIHDLEYAKEDKNGKMLKPTVKDKETGQTYEKYGHNLDALRYLVVKLLDYWYDKIAVN